MHPVPRFQIIAAMPIQERDHPSLLVKAFGLLSAEQSKTVCSHGQGTPEEPMVYFWTEILGTTHARHTNRTGLWLSHLEKLLFWQHKLPGVFWFQSSFLSEAARACQLPQVPNLILSINFLHGLLLPKPQFSLPIQEWHHHHGKPREEKKKATMRKKIRRQGVLLHIYG